MEKNSVYETVRKIFFAIGTSPEEQTDLQLLIPELDIQSKIAFYKVSVKLLRSGYIDDNKSTNLHSYKPKGKAVWDKVKDSEDQSIWEEALPDIIKV